MDVGRDGDRYVTRGVSGYIDGIDRDIDGDVDWYRWRCKWVWVSIRRRVREEGLGSNIDREGAREQFAAQGKHPLSNTTVYIKARSPTKSIDQSFTYLLARFHSITLQLTDLPINQGLFIEFFTSDTIVAMDWTPGIGGKAITPILTALGIILVLVRQDPIAAKRGHSANLE